MYEGYGIQLFNYFNYYFSFVRIVSTRIVSCYQPGMAKEKLDEFAIQYLKDMGSTLDEAEELVTE